MLTINDIIPKITADAFHKEKIKKISLSKYKKRWLILLFYPADFTFVCPTELREAADYYSEVKKLNTEIVSISTDTAFVHKAWHDNNIGRNILETLRKLQAAQFVRENKTLVCSASWKPGKKTLKPGVDLVGKI